MYIYIEYSFVIVVYRMLDTPISHIAKVAAAEGPVSGVDCLARASQHTHGTPWPCHHCHLPGAWRHAPGRPRTEAN